MEATNSTNRTAHEGSLHGGNYKIFFIFYEFLSVLGALLAMLLLAVIAFNKHLRGGSGYLILHLQSIHLVLCTSVFPVNIAVNYRVKQGWANSVDCTAMTFFIVVLVQAENYGSLMLAINRLVAIVFPYVYPTFTAKWTLGLMITVCWVIAIVSSIPAYTERHNYPNFHSGDCACSYMRSERTNALMSIFGSYLAIVAEGIIYIIVLFKVLNLGSRGNAVLQGNEGLFEKRKLRRKIALFRILATSYVWYCLCFLPNPVIVGAFPRAWAKQEPIALFALTISICGHVFNPVFYIIHSYDFRAGFRRLMENISSRARIFPTLVQSSRTSSKHRTNSIPLSASNKASL